MKCSCNPVICETLLIECYCRLDWKLVINVFIFSIVATVTSIQCQ